ncbi:RHS repeat-associated core domain-containing protein [Pseudomonas ogarae]|uniref:RHS repeat-associated core domain-containing protein n=1 Tax=Pseudomonas ogarae (strain DSM 112162 / CECT 30235 / F113) TaxID=1114970 RepID=UPI001F227E30|nr:RHS repeat-associated core domain-containing protein [Pseudomonas ogarae]
MPASPRETVLCRYRYDPLDSLVDCAPVEQAGIQRFYCKSRLATEIQGALQRSVFQHDDQLLAQRRREDAKVDTTLLATDQQRSVLNALDATGPHPLAYTPYGHRPAENGLLSLLGFNGERPGPVTGHYLLGNGYRAFNPVLMRFNSPDSLSPFGDGGVNAYAYCNGDPTNNTDPSGHFLYSALRTIASWIGKLDTFDDIYRYIQHGARVKTVENYTKPILDSDLEIFDVIRKKDRQLNIYGHGSKHRSGFSSNDRHRNMHDISDLLRSLKINLNKHGSACAFSCHSATNGTAQGLANLLGLKTKGFRGTVSGSTYRKGTNYQRRINKGGWLSRLTMSDINYDPITFYPNVISRQYPFTELEHLGPVKPRSTIIRRGST